MIIPIVRRYWASHSAYLWQRDVYHHVTWSTSLWRLGWFRWRWIEIVRRSRHVERNLYRRPDVCYMSKIYIIQYGSPGRPRHGSKCKTYYTPAAGPSLDGVHLLCCCSHRFHGTRNVHSPHAGRQGELQSAGYDCTDNRENTTPELFAGGAKCIW